MNTRDQLKALFARAFPRFWKRFAAWRVRQHNLKTWAPRIAEVLSCKDNARIPRAKNAGRVKNGFQVMHNGLKVLVDGYYGSGGTELLRVNRGAHEPQEEVVFEAVVQSLPPGSSMMEAGAYWGFYSMWFMQVVKEGRAFLIEPDSKNLEVGRRNFQENHFHGEFIHAYAGAAPDLQPDGVPVVSIDSIFSEKRLEKVTLLHSDIQGAELDLLRGARTQIERGLIDYIFVSTHSPELHEQCAAFLEKCRWRIFASVNLEESYSYDGFLAACGPCVDPPAFDPPSKKPH